jgi:hypothetical protein
VLIEFPLLLKHCSSPETCCVTSCELINILDASAKKTSKVAIDTDGLKMINGFGLDVFLPRMVRLNNTRVDIEVTGRFKGIFRE